MRDVIEKAAAASSEEDIRKSDWYLELIGEESVRRDKNGNLAYPGPLGKAIDKERFVTDSLLDGEIKFYDKMAIEDEYDEKLEALYAYYNVWHDSSDEMFKLTLEDAHKLILAVAKEHIPGFKFKEEKNEVGRPPTWDNEEFKKLHEDISKYLENNPSHGKLAACRYLLKNKREYGSISDPESLRSTYNRLRRKLRDKNISIDSL